ncbi:hypothetical protein RRG08_012065 [Elysia crispata]|uniref:Uncharacterized protein n=1 Tax=Elysia crispata TaxID=231223 RepID=A0AAE1BDN7_9GAST|nr:hypothetical protein RRG08_012065 [Elysia crispata]
MNHVMMNPFRKQRPRQRVNSVTVDAQLKYTISDSTATDWVQKHNQIMCRDLSPPRTRSQSMCRDLSPPKKHNQIMCRDLSPPRTRSQIMCRDLSPPRTQQPQQSPLTEHMEEYEARPERSKSDDVLLAELVKQQLAYSSEVGDITEFELRKRIKL